MYKTLLTITALTILSSCNSKYDSVGDKANLGNDALPSEKSSTEVDSTIGYHGF